MGITDRINLLTRKVPVWVIYTIGLLPAPAWFGLAATGRLGPDPIDALIGQYGELALQLLIAGLAITPLRKNLGLNLLRFRRAIGLLAFYYVSCHLLAWAILDRQILASIIGDILSKPYLMVGTLSFMLMIPLAVTSNNRSIKALGAKWRKLHQATYAVCLLGGVHFLMQAKGSPMEPKVYLLIIIGLLSVRVANYLKA